MNLNSKYFDRIRIHSGEAAVESKAAPRCEWQGCGQAGGYRAPKGRSREGQYYSFCLDHVRDYNKSYNYFAGMGDDDIIAYQRAAATGHRPTWTMGVKRDRENLSHGGAEGFWADGLSDPFGLFGGAFAPEGAAEPRVERKPVNNAARRSFATLDLDVTENAVGIKARYKELVKRLHPDANGGDRSSEDRLRQIIQAYHYLKSAGFC